MVIEGREGGMKLCDEYSMAILLTFAVQWLKVSRLHSFSSSVLDNVPPTSPCKKKAA